MTEQPHILVVVGANHRSSTMGFRDRLFVEDRAVPAFLDSVRAGGVGQALVLCTGERIDVVGFAADGAAGADVIVAALAENAALPAADVRAQVYVLDGAEAARHVFRVAAALDSLVVGEGHILGQLRTALGAAVEAGGGGAELTALIEAAGRAAKRVETETDLGGSPVSLAAAAVQVAHDLHGDLARCSGLLVGGGDTSELIVEDLIAAGLGHVSVAHPTPARAEASARALGGHTVAFDGLAAALAEADVVVSALGASAHVITAEMVKGVIRKRRYKPIFLIDAGIPGDVDPAVEKLEEAFVYTLDDLERVAMASRTTARGGADEAARLVDEAVAAYTGGGGGSIEGDLEQARAEALAEAGNDAETATRLFLDRVKSLLRKE